MYHNTKNIHKGNSTSSTSKLGDNKIMDMIKRYRLGKEKKQEIELIPYQRYVAPPILSSEKVIGKTVSPKYEELTNVFRKCGEEMEWEATEMQITEKFEGVREWVTEKEWTNII
ncbi:unnamed protein product [Rhizophagus irregularis]|uniref:Uncharacterized protein n=1 Tax=Rhizophagus irregularis TaxID=588596 RepID=A0A916EFH5_9GLOM|nr:unnamed protein product [Rhizophagus irregularis]